MNMIRHSTHSLGMRVQTIYDATEVRMEFVQLFLGEGGFAAFRREDEMVMQAGMG